MTASKLVPSSTNFCFISLVHGGYSGWSAWPECSSSCGGGVTTRSRMCDNPSPKYGGKDCSAGDRGAAVESKACNSFACEGLDSLKFLVFSDFRSVHMSLANGRLALVVSY